MDFRSRQLCSLLMKHGCSWMLSHVSVIWPHPFQFYTHIHFNITFPSIPSLPKFRAFEILQPKFWIISCFPYAYLHPIRLIYALIITALAEEYEVWISSTYNLWNSLLPSFLLGLNIPFHIVSFLHTSYFCYLWRMRDQVSHPYKTNDTV
jgi:hypothetical protein